jgi:hypothetical protein
MIARIWHGVVPVSKGNNTWTLCEGLRFPSIWRRREIVEHGVCVTDGEETHFEMPHVLG